MTMHIACAATGNYVPHAATMLKSLLVNTPGAEACVHFLHDDDFGPDRQKLLEQMLAEHGAQLHCIATSQKLPSGLPIAAHYTAAAWFRVLLPDLLPDLDRVLYLDCDLIVVGSLLPLWQMPLHDHILAAVTNAYSHSPDMASALGLPDLSSYFNSGVMLMNLELMRREGTALQVFSYAKANPHLVRYADQDPMNALLHARRLNLELRYNVQADCYDPNNPPAVLPEAEVREGLAHPVIVHFSSRWWKPWDARCEHPLRGLYAEYRKLTPWPEFSLEGPTVRDRLRTLIPKHWMPILSRWRARLKF